MLNLHWTFLFVVINFSLEKMLNQRLKNRVFKNRLTGQTHRVLSNQVNPTEFGFFSFFYTKSGWPGGRTGWTGNPMTLPNQLKSRFSKCCMCEHMFENKMSLQLILIEFKYKNVSTNYYHMKMSFAISSYNTFLHVNFTDVTRKKIRWKYIEVLVYRKII